MNQTRKIKEAETDLLVFLLRYLDLEPSKYPIDQVYEYEGGKMGSISLGLAQPENYAGDLVQVEYTDTDGTPVVITLTHDHQQQLLDLDFWKTDFSKLIQYPKPEELRFL
jgi:hypothetical protein